MSAYDVLESTLNQILHAIKPLREDWDARAEVINEFQAVVQSVESFRGATVEPFGSFISNLFSRWGDLDISIEIQNGSYISSVGKKRKQSLLRDIHKVLQRRGGWRKLQFISHARVPILKFETTYHNISCDISINNLAGQMKSKFLFWISEIDGRFRDMVLMVKEWANAHDINSSKTGTLNSYSLSLLVIFHFQTCVPAILPPLKEIYPRNVVEDLTGVRDLAERRIKETSAANIARFKSDRSRILNRSSLSELFVSFLAKFSDIDSMALEQGICTYNGQWEEINSNMRWLPHTYAILIEDPFAQPENAARAVSSRQLTRISKVFKETHRRLVSPNQNLSSLVSTLARPQIVQFIPRTELQTQPEFAGGYIRTHPQVHRAAQPPLQFQHRSQNTRLKRQPNNYTPQRPAQTYQSNGQQMWRPRSDR